MISILAIGILSLPIFTLSFSFFHISSVSNIISIPATLISSYLFLKIIIDSMSWLKDFYKEKIVYHKDNAIALTYLIKKLSLLDYDPTNMPLYQKELIFSMFKQANKWIPNVFSLTIQKNKFFAFIRTYQNMADVLCFVSTNEKKAS